MDRKILIQELSEGLAGRKDMPLKDAELFVRSVFEIVEEYLQTDKLVKIKGFGTFKLVRVDSRESVDVNTGERIVINGYTKVSFTPDTTLRDEINKPFAQFETVILYDNTDLSEMEKIDAQETDEQIKNDADEEVNEGSDQMIDAGGVGNEAETSPESSTDENDGQNDTLEDDNVPVGENPEEDQNADVDTEKQADGDGIISDKIVDPATVSDNVSEEVTDEEAGDVDLTDDVSVSRGTAEGHAGAVSADMEEADADVSDPEPTPEKGNEKSEIQADPVGNTTDTSEPADRIEDEAADEVQHIEYLHAGYQHVGHQKADNQHVRHQKVGEQSAGKQTVEVQHVENQTVENQHIVQMSSSGKKRRRIPPVWLMVLSVLIVFLLMLGSYFIGYYRLLCPGGCDIGKKPEPILPVLDEQEDGAADSVTVADSDKAVEGKDSVAVSSVNKAKRADAVANKDNTLNEKKINTSGESQTNKANQNVPQKNFDKLYPQLKEGRYQIVGTKGIHQLQSGETLRHLALKYYGSKNFVPYIVVYNQIKNPDVIPVGQKLKLPELRLRGQ